MLRIRGPARCILATALVGGPLVLAACGRAAVPAAAPVASATASTSAPAASSAAAPSSASAAGVSSSAGASGSTIPQTGAPDLLEGALLALVGAAGVAFGWSRLRDARR